jgi:hypothetical protein
LANEVEYWNAFGAGFYPGIVINNRTYRGDMSSEDVFEAVCAGFKTRPSECLSEDDETLFTGISPATLMIVVVVLLLVNVVLLMIYRRYQNKEQKEDMQL